MSKNNFLGKPSKYKLRNFGHGPKRGGGGDGTAKPLIKVKYGHVSWGGGGGGASSKIAFAFVFLPNHPLFGHCPIFSCFLLVTPSFR